MKQASKRMLLLLTAVASAMVLASGAGLSGHGPSGPSVVEAQTSKKETLSGIFAVRYGDPFKEPDAELSDGEHKIQYVLTDDQGQNTKLQMDEKDAKPAGGTLTLVGKRVEVEGTGTPGDKLKVEKIQRKRSDTASERSAFEAEAAMTGSKPVATILCRFADSPNVTPHDRSWFNTLVSGSSKPGIDHFWREVSYNNINLSGSQVFGWYNLPHNRSYYLDANGDANVDLLTVECTGAADSAVYFPGYTTINMMFNDELDGSAWGGWSTLTRDGQTKTYGTTWMPPWGYENAGILGHEMGHSYGLPHSSGPYNQTYDSWWDVMSSGGTFFRNLTNKTDCHRDATYGCLAMHTISAHKDKLGWIPSSQKYTATTASDQNITIERLGAAANGNYQMAKVPIGGSSTVFYTVEARRFVDHYDSYTAGEGIVIHKVDTTNATELNRIARVVDSDNNGNPNDAGALWLPGETFTDSANGIKVKVNQMTTSGYNVTINPSGGQDTTPPSISLTAPQDGSTVSGSSVTLSADATDNVGVKEVRFYVDGSQVGIDTTAGGTSGKEYSVNWDSTSVSNGQKTIEARAYDNANNEKVSSSRTITVNNDTGAPTIQSMWPYPELTRVSRYTNITARFSEEMDKNTLTIYSVTLYKNGTGYPIYATVTSSSDGLTVMLDPWYRLSKKTWYKVVIWGGSNGAKNLAGNPVAPEGDYVSWRFKTGRR